MQSAAPQKETAKIF